MSLKKDLHLCIDRVVPLHQKHLAADLSIAENPKNRPNLPALGLGVSAHPAKMALFTGKRWQPGRKLGVRFLDGSKYQKAKVIQYAQSWSQYCSITFNFKAGSKAEIRVSFRADPGSWSAVGTDCLLHDAFPKSHPTVNFGWLRDDTDDVECRRVVTHEFGHALGCIHEHQNPKGGIRWNLRAVYDYFSGPPNNWTKDEIDFNVVQKYSIDQLNATKFDRKSIMLYSFPPALIVGGKGTPNNTEISTADMKFIRKNYP
jgi:hypothetical protein